MLFVAVFPFFQMVTAGMSDRIILIDSDKYFASTERLSYTNLMTPDFIWDVSYPS